MRDDIYVGALFSDNYLEHHGILGMKWGVRRYQNPDGSLTEAGKRRYSKQLYKKVKSKKREDHTSLYGDKRMYEAATSEKVTKTFNELSSAAKVYDNFARDRKATYYYTEMAARVAARRYGKGNPDINEQDWIDSYFHDDANQGPYNSFQCYLIDKKGINPANYHTNISRKLDSFVDASKESSAELLGKYKDAPISKHVKKWKAKDEVAYTIRDMVMNMSSSEPLNAYSESYLSPEAAKDLANVKKYISEIKRTSMRRH